jgi:hypothetical protein
MAVKARRRSSVRKLLFSLLFLSTPFCRGTLSAQGDVTID